MKAWIKKAFQVSKRNWINLQKINNIKGYYISEILKSQKVALHTGSVLLNATSHESKSIPLLAYHVYSSGLRTLRYIILIINIVICALSDASPKLLEISSQHYTFFVFDF